MRLKNPEGQLARWLEVLSVFHMKPNQQVTLCKANKTKTRKKRSKTVWPISQKLTDVVSGEGRFLKSLWLQFLSIEVQDGMLYRRRNNSGKTSTMQAILPYSEKRNALFLRHDNQSSGHLGVRNTLAELWQKYYCPGLQEYVRTYTAEGDQSSRTKGQ